MTTARWVDDDPLQLVRDLAHFLVERLNEMSRESTDSVDRARAISRREHVLWWLGMAQREHSIGLAVEALLPIANEFDWHPDFEELWRVGST